MSYGCERCDGTGFLPEVLDAEGVPRPVRCDCMKRHIARARRSKLAKAIPSRYVTAHTADAYFATLDERIQTRIRRATQKIGSRIEEGKGLWLSGPSGTAKSYCAAVVAAEAHRQGFTVAWWNVPDLLLEIRRTYAQRRPDDEPRDDESALLDQLENIDLIVLDDLGVIGGTDADRRLLYRIINRRWDVTKALILTTDLEDDQLSKLIGKRVFSRLAEMTGWPVRFDGDDRRLAKRDIDFDAEPILARDARQTESAG